MAPRQRARLATRPDRPERPSAPGRVGAMNDTAPPSPTLRGCPRAGRHERRPSVMVLFGGCFASTRSPARPRAACCGRSTGTGTTSSPWASRRPAGGGSPRTTWTAGHLAIPAPCRSRTPPRTCCRRRRPTTVTSRCSRPGRCCVRSAGRRRVPLLHGPFGEDGTLQGMRWPRRRAVRRRGRARVRRRHGQAHDEVSSSSPGTGCPSGRSPSSAGRAGARPRGRRAPRRAPGLPLSGQARPGRVLAGHHASTTSPTCRPRSRPHGSTTRRSSWRPASSAARSRRGPRWPRRASVRPRREIVDNLPLFYDFEAKYWTRTASRFVGVAWPTCPRTSSRRSGTSPCGRSRAIGQREDTRKVDVP